MVEGLPLSAAGCSYIGWTGLESKRELREGFGVCVIRAGGGIVECLK